MLYGNRIDVSEGISFNKTNNFHKCKLYHYNYFFNVKFSFEPCVCNDCYDFLQKAISFNKIAVASVEVNSYKSLEQL